MKKRFIFIVILMIITILILKITLTKKNVNQTKIENYIKELFTIIDSLKNAKCITPDILKNNKQIILNNTEAEKLFSELISNGKSISPSIIQSYKDLYKRYTDTYSTFKDCSNYCLQGDLTTGNCVCPSSFPFPIQYENKVYCSDEDYTKIPNALFVPSSSNDPSQNKLECKDGYVKDTNNKFNCKKIINCSMSDWQYGACDQETGFKYKSRRVLVAPENGGTVCPSNLKNVGETETVLSDVTCPVNCQLNEDQWTNWSDCNLSNGTQTRTTTIKYQSRNNGATCPPTTQTQDCKVDCQLDEDRWGNWSTCDPSNGTQTRTTSIKYESRNNGATCPPTTQSRPCTVNCQLDEDRWTNWSTCDPSNGTQTRTTSIKYQSRNNGATCPPTTQTQDCKVDCQLNEWSAWSACNPNTKTQTRTRTVKYTNRNGGATCSPNTSETKECEGPTCPPNIQPQYCLPLNTNWTNQYYSIYVNDNDKIRIYLSGRNTIYYGINKRYIDNKIVFDSDFPSDGTISIIMNDRNNLTLQSSRASFSFRRTS